MHLSRPIFFAAVFSVFLGISTPAYGWPVAIKNGNLEESGIASSVLPWVSGFKTYETPKTRASFRLEKGIAHSGKKSLYIRNYGPQTALWMVDGGVPCVEGIGIRYKISVWVKTLKAAGFVGISVRYKDKKGNYITGPIRGDTNVSGTRDWQQISFTVVPPVGANSFDLFLMNDCEGKSGEVWFDDLTVEEKGLGSAIINEAPRAIDMMAKAAKLKAVSLFDKPELSPDVLAQWSAKGGFLLDLVKRLSPSQPPSAELRERIVSDWTALRDYTQRVERGVRLTEAVSRWRKVCGDEKALYFVGWQNSMTRVWIRDLPNSLEIKTTGYLETVKGETEALQLALGAIKKPLKGVRLRVEDLAGPAGVIPASQIGIHPVGFVNIKKPTKLGPYPIEKEYEGWWPEILLENFPFDVAPGEVQPVWLSVRVPRGIKAGVYKGTVLVEPSNDAPVKLELKVKVYDCELPEAWHFRNIMSFHDAFAKEFYGDEWTPGMRDKFLDFLLERRINLASMYRDTDFTWEEISKGVGKGQNTILIYTIDEHAGLKKAPSMPPWIEQSVFESASKTADTWVPRLKEAGWLNMSLLYAFDEVSYEWFEAAKNVFRTFKVKYPGLKTISTIKDRSYGLETGLIEVVDNFMPHMDVYDPRQAQKARSRGAGVWWYESMWNIEQPLTMNRLIPWMTYKVKADGFLIWCINRWKGGVIQSLPKSAWKTNTRPVENKIFNDWDPWLDGVNPNSTANYLYPGVHGPLSSTRLENFRDGIEDYELLIEAAGRLEKLRKTGGNRKKIAVLQKAVTIEDDFIRDAVHVDYDPKRIMEHRKHLIEALVATRQH